jgi:insulin receptor substrate 4
MVWKVKVVPRGLGGVKNITGSYKLCLKDNTLYFVNPVSQDVIIEERLYHVRKFGYWDNCVFMEFGRSTALGPGEIWMEVEDPLIAQKIEDSLSRFVYRRQ